MTLGVAGTTLNDELNRLANGGTYRAVGVMVDQALAARQKSFKARHAKNISKGKMSAAYWADNVKW